ncbi:hypothetical protein BDR04DRAFT_1032337 [Suillus decipiens]|nr:hypothetical protein BDR04DRAFT_1032337 [Suillus decipiens]
MSSLVQDFILQQPDIRSTLGALFIGVIISAVLFGLSNVQAFIYFQTHKDTGMTFYKFSWNLRMLDALHLALIVHCNYYHLVINYANFDALIGIVWSFKLLASVIVQTMLLFLAHHFNPMSVLIWAIYQCHVSSDLVKIEWATYTSLVSITFTDIVIASSLCYLLATSRTGFSSTDSLITKFMVYIINTGCLTSICSIAAMITCAVMPTNFTFIAIEFLLAKGIVKTLSLRSTDQWSYFKYMSIHSLHS